MTTNCWSYISENMWHPMTSVEAKVCENLKVTLTNWLTGVGAGDATTSANHNFSAFFPHFNNSSAADQTTMGGWPRGNNQPLKRPRYATNYFCGHIQNPSLYTAVCRLGCIDAESFTNHDHCWWSLTWWIPELVPIRVCVMWSPHCGQGWDWSCSRYWWQTHTYYDILACWRLTRTKSGKYGPRALWSQFYMSLGSLYVPRDV